MIARLSGSFYLNISKSKKIPVVEKHPVVEIFAAGLTGFLVQGVPRNMTVGE